MSPRDDNDGAAVFIEGKVSEIERAGCSEVHGRSPRHVPVTLHHHRLNRVRRHRVSVKTEYKISRKYWTLQYIDRRTTVQV